MVLLITVPEARRRLADAVRSRRLALGLTQAGLALRANVALPTFRRFEQKAHFSLDSFVKVLAVLDLLEPVIAAVKPKPTFASIDDVLTMPSAPKRGSRT
jgi:transcriptional regulator with XRE-family HTH domain